VGAAVSRFDLIGYVASILVLLTFMTENMRHLRVIAILSNITFMAYGALASLPSILRLYLVLLPVKLPRLGEETKTGPKGSERITHLLYMRKAVGQVG
jgi:hypothetical protein